MLHDDGDSLPAATGPLVLVVDDEATPRTTLTRMLHGLGYQGRNCPSGRSALRFLEAHPGAVRLVLADVAMPGMDGGELAERARDLDPRIAVVLMARPGDAAAEELLAGYHDLPLLAKPVGLSDLASRMEELVGAPPVHGSAAGYPLADQPRRRRRGSGRHGPV